MERFAQCIAGGGVALFPTDTVYGLACDPLQVGAVRRLYELKGRPPTQPAAVMFFALAPALAALTELGPRTRAALTKLLPGPVTVLLANPSGRYPLACAPAAALAGEVVDGATSLGLRVPRLPEHLVALGALDGPVLQSSANLSGQPESRNLVDVAASVRDGVDLALDGGELPGIASTVLDLRDYERAGSWTVARAGPLAHAELQQVLG
ncbi:MAG TPA: Sua5/YciO/YrdC/YwlC family protein [Solirubrobacteraceae bacterium]